MIGYQVPSASLPALAPVPENSVFPEPLAAPRPRDIRVTLMWEVMLSVIFPTMAPLTGDGRATPFDRDTSSLSRCFRSATDIGHSSYLNPGG